MVDMQWRGELRKLGVWSPRAMCPPSFGAGVGEREAGGVRVALEEHVGGADGTAVVGVFGYMSNKAVE
jgi:hypothetical protein